MCEVAFVLHGRRDGVRLPWDVCSHIATMAASHPVWLACRHCACPLLILRQNTLFIANVDTPWLVSNGWLVAGTNEAHWSRSVPISDATNAFHLPPHEPDVWYKACLSTTPEWIVAGERAIRNVGETLHQVEWYKMIGGIPTCRACAWTGRVRSRVFHAWASSTNFSSH